MSKYLIIGGSGFIGQSICKKLKNNFLILDKTAPKMFKNFFLKCNINNLHSLQQNICDNSILINLAAEHKDDTFPIGKFYETNYEAAKKICRIADIKKVKKIIYFSSVAVYKKSNKPLNENSSTGFRNHYGYSKLLAEMVYKNWQKKNTKDRQLIIIRPTAVYGSNNFNNVTRLINLVKKRVVVFPGDAQNIKSIAYIENLVNFTLFVIRNTKSKLKIYNYADPKQLSMHDLIRLCARTFNYNFFIFFRLNNFFVNIIIIVLKKISFLNKKINILIERIEKVSSNSIIISNENYKLLNIVNPEAALKKIINIKSNV